MAKDVVIEGVMAVNKPESITSTEIIRTLQKRFGESSLFAPSIAFNKATEQAKPSHQRKRQRPWNKENLVKLGHGGTLDPLATGVLIIGVGSGTKSLQQFLTCTKTYETTVVFGAESDTYDVMGKAMKTSGWESVTKESIQEALKKFKGTFMQRPPLFSAKWINGERAYDLARRGETIPEGALQEREVHVDEMELLEFWDEGSHAFVMRTGEELQNVQTRPKEGRRGQKRKRNAPNDSPEPPPSKAAKEENTTTKSEDQAAAEAVGIEAPVMSGALPAPSDGEPSDGIPKADEEPVKLGPAARIRMTVSSGFYVRSLCHDLGQSLGSSAVMATLVRMRQAEFETGKNVLDYDDLEKGEEVWGPKIKDFLDRWQQKHSKES